MRVTIVGGGILGTAHALEAVARGHDVVHLEREPEARGATVRNFGLVWVSGRSRGELAAAMRSRELWEKLGADVPGIGFRAVGSITLMRTPGEVAVAEEVVARADAECRGFRLLEPRRRPGREPGAARQLPRGTALCTRRRGRVSAGAARDARPHGRQRQVHLHSAHRSEICRRAPPCSTTAATRMRVTWCWCARAPRMAGWSARSQANCRFGGCACR